MLIPLCQLADLPAGSARGFELPPTLLVAVRDRSGVHVYLNRCPHLGVPLLWQNQRAEGGEQQGQSFFDASGQLLRCSTHGALFEPATGYCLQGPCRGESLWKIDCSIAAGRVLIDTDELHAPPPILP